MSNLPKLPKLPKKTKKEGKVVEKPAEPAKVLKFEKPTDTFNLSENSNSESIDLVLEKLRELPGYYYQNGSVRVVRVLEDPEGVIDKQGPRIIQATPSGIQKDLESVVTFQKNRSSDGEDVKTTYAKPPSDLARFPIENPSETGLRELVGLTSHPFMRRDGTFLDDPGYDPVTGFFHTPIPGLAVKDAPTKQDAEEARDILLEPLVEFPFQGEADKSSVLAAILSAFCMQAHAYTPAVAFDASKPGSGKTYLMDLVSIIATGHDTSKLSWSETPGEIEKLVAARLDAGCEFIAFDNLDGPIKATSTLERALTGIGFESRRLGKSELISVPWHHLVFFTGNNIQMVRGDMVRRTGMYSRLLPPTANSHLREANSFKIGDLKEYARTNRVRLASAAITILKAHQMAGAPLPTAEGYTLLNTFEAWDSRINGALNWLGLPAARRFPEGEDEETTALVQFLNALRKRVLLNGGPVRAADLVTTAQNADLAEEKELAGLLLELTGNCSRVGDLTSQKVGKALRKFMDTPTESGTLRREQDRTNSAVWIVEDA